MTMHERQFLSEQLTTYYNRLYHSAGRGIWAEFNSTAKEMFDVLERLEMATLKLEFDKWCRVLQAGAVLVLLTALCYLAVTPVRNICGLALLGVAVFYMFFSISYAQLVKVKTETRQMRRVRTAALLRRDFEEKLQKHPYETQNRDMAMGE